MTTSDSGDDILTRLARRNGGESTTIGALAEWLASGECPPDIIRSAAWSILELVTKSGDWMNSDLVDVMSTLHQPFGERLDAEHPPGSTEPDLMIPSREPGTSTKIKLDTARDMTVVDYSGRMISTSGALSATDETFSVAVRLPDLLTFWNSLPVDDRPRDGFPLEILYMAWLNRPQLVTLSARARGASYQPNWLTLLRGTDRPANCSRWPPT